MKAIMNRWRNDMSTGDRNPVPVATVERPLSKQAQAAIEAHYTEIVALKDERDKALEENDKARELCVQAKHEINALNADVADLKSRCLSYQLERDQAVAKFAALEGFFISLLAQMKAHKVPEAPPQTVASDAEAAPVLELRVPKMDGRDVIREAKKVQRPNEKTQA